MRRTLTAVVTAGVIALPVVDTAAAARRAVAAVPKKKVVRVKTFTGSAFDADQWGTVQVTVTVQTTTIINGKKKAVTRKYTNLGARYSYHTDRSQFIMSQSLPYLRQEFLTAQSANVQAVSGATYTSDAFAQSLQSALLKAKSA